jgi:predicted MFS family arabinose efflux permease
MSRRINLAGGSHRVDRPDGHLSPFGPGVRMNVLERRRAINVFLAFAFAYFLSALLRSVTATLAPTLTREFGLNASDLGLLAGGYFIGFSLTQLPLGAWLDRFGPKRVVLGFLLLAVAGCVAFSIATNFAELLAARILCGVGVSACLMAPLTGYRRWFVPETQLRATSWMLMTGSLGMLASTLPVQWLMPLFGWRPLFWIMAAAIGISMLVLAWTVPGWPTAPAGPAGRTGRYAQVWRHPYFRRVMPIGFFSYGGMISIQTLWAGPWMVRVSGYAPLEAATGLFIINISMLCAFLGWGMLGPWLAQKGIGTDRLITLGVPSSFVVLALILVAGPAAGAAAWAAFCVSSTFLALVQPAIGLAFPPALAGRALSAYNLVVFGGVFVVQWAIGLLVDGFLAAGLTEVGAFRGSMSVFLACIMLSYAYFVLAKDNSRQ